MPKISFAETTVECKAGENLRHVLMNAGLPLYNSPANLIHCRGLGTCGTCAVEICGEVTEMTLIENWRLGFPPHRRDSGLRLACQCCVLGDLEIKKLSGLWGNRQ